MQQRLWFLQQLDPDSAAYLVPNARRHENLDVEALRRAFEALVTRHEILRTSFPLYEDEPYQKVHPITRYSLATEDASALDADEQASVLARVAREHRQPFDLGARPALRTTLVRVSEVSSPVTMRPSSSFATYAL